MNPITQNEKKADHQQTQRRKVRCGMKLTLAIFSLLMATSAWSQEKLLICKYDGMITLEEPGFWLLSKQDKSWYKIQGADVIKSYRPTEGEICIYQ
jgi:hypothetical protein